MNHMRIMEQETNPSNSSVNECPSPRDEKKTTHRHAEGGVALEIQWVS
jgi:hypothetical protein